MPVPEKISSGSGAFGGNMGGIDDILLADTIGAGGGTAGIVGMGRGGGGATRGGGGGALGGGGTSRGAGGGGGGNDGAIGAAGRIGFGAEGAMGGGVEIGRGADGGGLPLTGKLGGTDDVELGGSKRAIVK